jgi:lipase chaperone LimK
MFGKGVRNILLYGVLGVLTLIVSWHVFRKHDDGAFETRVAVAAPPLPAGGMAAPSDERDGPPTVRPPPSMAGSSAPRLPVDGAGHLVKSSAVRDFFDYCLSAQSDLSPADLETLVAHEVFMQLQDTVAATETLDVWSRYRTYFSELAQQRGTGVVPGDKFDPEAMELLLAQRAALANRMLGEWSAPFFDAELERQRFDLVRLKIALSPSLSDSQKADRLAELERQLPAEIRSQRAQLAQQQNTIIKITQLQDARENRDTLRAELIQSLGPETIDRMDRMQKEEDSWQAKYQEYAQQRSQIDAQQLPPQDYEAQVRPLRERYFQNAGDALRAAAFDRSATAPTAQE